MSGTIMIKYLDNLNAEDNSKRVNTISYEFEETAYF